MKVAKLRELLKNADGNADLVADRCDGIGMYQVLTAELATALYTNPETIHADLGEDLTPEHAYGKRKNVVIMSVEHPALSSR